MENRENQENNYDRARDDNAWLMLQLHGVLLVCLGMFYLIFRFHLRPEQLIEIAVYLGCVAGFAWSVFRYQKDYKEKRKRNLPHLRIHISCDRHEDNIQKSFAQKSTLVGYSGVSKRTVSWSDEVRTLQSILVGKSGFGNDHLYAEPCRPGCPACFRHRRTATAHAHGHLRRKRRP